jgi:3',5'-cyclic-AMP phosphodiesterase
MCQSNLTRRQLLRYAALVGVTFPVASAIDRGWLLSAVAGDGLAAPMNLELVTVTDTEAVITWFTGDPTQPDAFGRPLPVAAPGRVLIGTSPDPRSWVEAGVHDPTPYHYVEIAGLRPGTTYYWRAESAGQPAVPTVTPRTDPTSAAPPVFTTMVPPPGREIGRVAWLNDLHYGEQTSGLIYGNSSLPRGGLPPGFPVDPDHPYWRFMGSGAVSEAAGRGCTLLLANGDLSNEAEPSALSECKGVLDSFGQLGGTTDVVAGADRHYFVTRGNHDRWHSGAIYSQCTTDSTGTLHDCFGDSFTAGFEPGTQHFSITFGDSSARYRFVGLDSNDGSSTGVLRQSELDYLAAELDRGDPTIPLFHHPASATASLSGVPPVQDGLDTQDAAKFRQLLSGRDNVAGVYAGHTHRNNFSTNVETGAVPYFEGGAVKEYPGGYTVVRMFEGGYMANFWKTSAAEARAWSERSRGEYFGLGPDYFLGSLGDRNWSYAVDARRTSRARSRIR